MAGADFVRADLHVHTHGDGETAPDPDLAAYIQTALDRELGVLAVTDHNSARFAREAVALAESKGLLLLPGIEVSTHDGHLLGLFGPASLDQLEAFANPETLRLRTLSDTELRSDRSMLDLIGEISERGGLAIPAHVDAEDGMCQRLRSAELAEVLTHPGLAGLEFKSADALKGWFSAEDTEPARSAAWKARQANEALRERGLARLMSSDAHSVDKVGVDRGSRTLTRVRLDDRNFDAVRNALLYNPKARCKAEAVLPATYPRIVSASFQGGFLDGVELDFSPNLNCLIGGRGSGKSTALLAVRAALGASVSPDEDVDDPDRMPDVTTVAFIDSTGSARTAVRRRGESPIEPVSGSPIRLRLADLGQDESGRLARGYADRPEVILEFLDAFVVRHKFDEREEQLVSQLAENASELRRTSEHADQLLKFESEQSRLQASLKAAEEGKLESIAEWAALLAAQRPLLARLEDELRRASSSATGVPPIDIDFLAGEYGVDLSLRGKDFVEGPGGLREGLEELHVERLKVEAAGGLRLGEAAEKARKALERWDADQTALDARMAAKQADLEKEGLKVQAGAVRAIADRLKVVNGNLVELRKKRDAYRTALASRKVLVADSHTNRDLLYQARKATLKRIVDSANRDSDDLTIHVSFDRAGLNGEWRGWLTNAFGFRSPRVERLAALIQPHEFAEALLSDHPKILALKDSGGDAFFVDAEALKRVRTWDNIFTLQTMRLEDRPRLATHEAGSPEPKPFDHLSAGQQRSLLLSLLLCAERFEPLIIDQPEDHLDAQYIARAVVRHLEAAKERRQVIIATHSANLTVLGDAELVIPLQVDSGHGQPVDQGAVDRPVTRDRVCSLLEGGVEAYRRRGERYGFEFARVPS